MLLLQRLLRQRSLPSDVGGEDRDGDDDNYAQYNRKMEDDN